jgi:hypothetical protein
VYNIVLDVLRTLPQWEELPNDLGLKTTWNLLWTWSRCTHPHVIAHI